MTGRLSGYENVIENRSSRRWRPAVAAALAGVLVACSSGAPASAPATLSGAASIATAPPATATATSRPTVEPTPARTPGGDVADRGDEEELQPATYFVEPEGIPVRVVFTIPAGSRGWLSWIGSFKPELGYPYRWVGVSIVNVTNLVTNACTDHTARNPVVGPTVDNLATALTKLKPFEVTTAPTDVTIHGYSGKHLALTLPTMTTQLSNGKIAFTDCDEQQVKSWIGAPLSYAFWGYTGSATTEEFWVLDVDGRRLVIAANYRKDSPPADVAELQSILKSIEIIRTPA